MSRLATLCKGGFLIKIGSSITDGHAAIVRRKDNRTFEIEIGTIQLQISTSFFYCHIFFRISKQGSCLFGLERLTCKSFFEGRKGQIANLGNGILNRLPVLRICNSVIATYSSPHRRGESHDHCGAERAGEDLLPYSTDVLLHISNPFLAV